MTQMTPMGVPRRPVVLVILDGFGVNPGKLNNAIAQARTPRLDEYFFRYPSAMLDASGAGVGLPHGQAGSSESGHMVLGSGRRLRQDLVLIDEAIADGSIFENPMLLEATEKARVLRRPLHLLGLVSDGGVQSHVRHLMALIELCRCQGVLPLLHMITDGRDTPQKSILNDLADLEYALADAGGGFATVGGRYYAMDRGRRWDRTERAWRAIVLGKGRGAPSARAAVNAAYAAGETDEFIHPSVVGGYRGMQSADPMVLFNLRNDRSRQIADALASAEFDGFDRGAAPTADLMCLTACQVEWAAPFAFGPALPRITLNRLLSQRGIAQFHCAETEKSAHVTYFFNGGSGYVAEGEHHRLIPSPTVRTYDMKPEMSAAEVADAVIDAISSEQYGFIVVNFANGDMVGHTGCLDAAIRAVEAVDREAGRVLDAAVRHGCSALLTGADGNCELMVDPETDEPHTRHTTNPVPVLVVDEQRWVLAPGGSLADVAPTVLALMGLEKPREMTGRSLLLEALQPQPVAVLERSGIAAAG